MQGFFLFAFYPKIKSDEMQFSNSMLVHVMLHHFPIEKYLFC